MCCVTFVKVKSAFHCSDRNASKMADDKLTFVARCGGDRKAWEVLIRQSSADRVCDDIVSECAQAGAKNNADFWHDPTAFTDVISGLLNLFPAVFGHVN